MRNLTSENKQEADNPQKKMMQHTPAHRYQENYILFRAGFKQTERGLVWEKDGVYYGKEAALHKAYGEMRGPSLSLRSRGFRDAPGGNGKGLGGGVGGGDVANPDNGNHNATGGGRAAHNPHIVF